MNNNLHKIIMAAHRSKFNIEGRRKNVASLLAQSMNEIQIAEILGVNQSTISRDITALKQLSHKFVYDLAKSDLAFYYKSSLDGIDEVKKKTWELLRSQSLNPKEKLLALRIIKECNESRFALFKEGPSMMNVQMLEERIKEIESDRQVSQ